MVERDENTPLPPVVANCGSGGSAAIRRLRCKADARDLFREAVCNPIPSSVQVINATRKSRLGNIEVWLHFKVSKQDMDSILKRERYQDLGSSKLNYSAYGPPAWWTPDKLGAGRSCFDCETLPHFGRDHSAKDIIVNEGNTAIEDLDEVIVDYDFLLWDRALFPPPASPSP